MFESCVVWVCELSAFSIIGLLGFVCYVCTFASVQFRLIDGNGLLFSFLSVTAASLVLISLTENFNLASALIQISWITIGACGIMIRIYRLKGTALKS